VAFEDKQIAMLQVAFHPAINRLLAAKAQSQVINQLSLVTSRKARTILLCDFAEAMPTSRVFLFSRNATQSSRTKRETEAGALPGSGQLNRLLTKRSTSAMPPVGLSRSLDVAVHIGR
jgi:hypothetical protein